LLPSSNWAIGRPDWNGQRRGLQPRKVDVKRRGSRIDQDHAAGRRARHKRAFRIAARKKPGIERMQAIDILSRRNGFDDAARIEPVRQWQLHKDSVDRRIGIELFDEGKQLCFAGRRGKVVLDRVKPAGLRGLAFGFDIDLTCRIFADEDDR
jgi:hypothetical protein